MHITYWSDYACPYCYIAERRLHNAIKSMGMEAEVILEPRAFELDPGAAKTVQSDTATRFARKYGLPLAQAQAQIEHISALGREAGIDFRYAETQYTNTFDAHRLMKLALSTGDRNLAAKTNELLFAAYFTKNLRLAEESTLVDVGLEAGLDRERILAMLHSDEFAAEVRADERAAAERGVRGVPFFLFQDGMTIPGAISEHDFREILQRNRTSAPAAQQCGPEGCAVNFVK
ncbi:DsbA family oxidoreductase [Desulfovibrio sp.]|uniref:DsbA family oxidoreductase n=1 Tax=Desulfovibrio sp. TaxID=885 RepID=UPI0023D190B8|nr:DsbA family oxidoreductase [Desulfovibrio sp.]MDE7240468.1 DsbA family oxidoreductase [Desulfovibrio sp.]